MPVSPSFGSPLIGTLLRWDFANVFRSCPFFSKYFSHRTRLTHHTALLFLAISVLHATTCLHPQLSLRISGCSSYASFLYIYRKLRSSSSIPFHGQLLLAFTCLSYSIFYWFCFLGSLSCGWTFHILIFVSSRKIIPLPHDELHLQYLPI
jgi:hypothetical protein